MAAVSGSSSSSSAVLPAPPALQRIEGADALEAACGERYRKARTDLGIGISQREDEAASAVRGGMTCPARPV